MSLIQNQQIFFRTNVRYEDMLKCSEKYFKSNVKSCNIDLPIHFRKEKETDSIKNGLIISFIKDNSLYFINLSKIENTCELLICDGTYILRPATIEEKNIFINELNNLTEEEKETYSTLINNIKKSLLSTPEIGKLK